MNHAQAARYEALHDPSVSREPPAFAGLLELSEAEAKARIASAATAILKRDGAPHLRAELELFRAARKQTDRYLRDLARRDYGPPEPLSEAEVDGLLDELERLRGVARSKRAEGEPDSEEDRDADWLSARLGILRDCTEEARLRQELRVRTLQMHAYEGVLERHRLGLDAPRPTAVKEGVRPPGRPPKTVYVALAMHVLFGPDTHASQQGAVKTEVEFRRRIDALVGEERVAKFSIGGLSFDFEVAKFTKDLYRTLKSKLEEHGDLPPRGEMGHDEYFPLIKKAVGVAYERLARGPSFEPTEAWY